MGAEELMPGCYVTFKDCLDGGEFLPVRIVQVTEGDDTFFARVGNEECSDEFGFDEEIVPVLLTSAILEQNGWFLANGVWVLKSSPRLGWNPRTKELITGYYTFPATIEYVHQLQILMRMLGVEETIKL